MYIIAIAWLYVALLAAISDTTVIGGILTFIFWGVAPLALFLWLTGTPARRRHSEKRERATEADSNDKTDSGDGQ